MAEAVKAVCDNAGRFQQSSNYRLGPNYFTLCLYGLAPIPDCPPLDSDGRHFPWSARLLRLCPYVDGPGGQGLCGTLTTLVGCFHMSGLTMGYLRSLVLMKSADWIPTRVARTKRWTLRELFPILGSIARHPNLNSKIGCCECKYLI
jgi:hypothetical protein